MNKRVNVRTFFLVATRWIRRLLKRLSAPGSGPYFAGC